MFPPRRALTTVFTLGAASLAAAAIAAPAGADNGSGVMVVTGECITGAPADKPAPFFSYKLDTNAQTTNGARVDLRGSLAVKRGVIGPVKVKGCVSTIKPMITRTYVLVKAPKSARYIVALTKWTTATGSAGKLAAPRFKNEAAFSAAVKPLAQKLTIPGIAGTVYGPVGSPFALMATTAGGKPFSDAAKKALAARYIKTGGYASQPSL